MPYITDRYTLGNLIQRIAFRMLEDDAYWDTSESGDTKRMLILHKTMELYYLDQPMQDRNWHQSIDNLCNAAYRKDRPLLVVLAKLAETLKQGYFNPDFHHTDSHTNILIARAFVDVIRTYESMSEQDLLRVFKNNETINYDIFSATNERSVLGQFGIINNILRIIATSGEDDYDVAVNAISQTNKLHFEEDAVYTSLLSLPSAQFLEYLVDPRYYYSYDYRGYSFFGLRHPFSTRCNTSHSSYLDAHFWRTYLEGFLNRLHMEELISSGQRHRGVATLCNGLYKRCHVACFMNSLFQCEPPLSNAHYDNPSAMLFLAKAGRGSLHCINESEDYAVEAVQNIVNFNNNVNSPGFTAYTLTYFKHFLQSTDLADKVTINDDSTTLSFEQPKLAAFPTKELSPSPSSGPEAAIELAKWLRECFRGVSGKDSWSFLSKINGGLSVANNKGYRRWRCKAHGKLDCVECACPICGAPGGCDCHARTVKNYSSGPPVPEHKVEARRIGIEMELVSSDGNALQRALESYPYCHFDASLGSYGFEAKFVDYHDQMHRIVKHMRNIARTGARATRVCGLHVHVERRLEHRLQIARRWIAIEQDLFTLFPNRIGNAYCRPIGNARTDDDSLLYAIEDHHSAIMFSNHVPTVEIRIHPGTMFWIFAICWADWCYRFVTETFTGHSIGERYLKARKAMRMSLAATDHPTPINLNPMMWRKAVRAYAKNHSIQNTFKAIENGNFEEFEKYDTLAPLLERERNNTSCL